MILIIKEIWCLSVDFYSGRNQIRSDQSLSCVRLFVTPWTVAHQAPLTLEFSRQEYWSGLPFPSPGDLPNPGIEPESPALQADSLPSEPPGKHVYVYTHTHTHTHTHIYIYIPLKCKHLIASPVIISFNPTVFLTV